MEPDQTAGLGAALTAQPEMQAPAVPDMPQADPMAESPQADPARDEDMARQMYARCMIILYNEKFIPKAVDMITGPNGPEMGMAHVAATIAARVILETRDHGEDIPGNVALHAGSEFMKELADFAGQFAGVQVDQEMLENAFLAASDTLRTFLENEGFNFTMIDDPEAQEWVKNESGGDEALAQMKGRAKQAMTQPEVRRMQRRGGLGMVVEEEVT